MGCENEDERRDASYIEKSKRHTFHFVHAVFLNARFQDQSIWRYGKPH